MLRTPLAVFAAGLAIAAGPAARADDAKDIAVKVTSAGAAMFDARDAKGLSLTYTEDARLDVYGKDGNTGTLKCDTKAGRTEIASYYEQLFKHDGPVHARNTVEHARMIEPDMLLITGLFEPNTENAEPLKLPFTQVRVKQGDAWRVVSVQVFVFPQK